MTNLYICCNHSLSKVNNPVSHLNTFKTLISAKYSDPAFDGGALKILTQNNVLAFSRTYNSQFYPTYVTLVNFNIESTNVNFSGQFTEVANVGYVILSTLGLDSEFHAGLVLGFISFTSVLLFKYILLIFSGIRLISHH